jgi:hypothetical protein
MNMSLKIKMVFKSVQTEVFGPKRPKNYISLLMLSICDKTEKITILTFVIVKKKQRPKALLCFLEK